MKGKCDVCGKKNLKNVASHKRMAHKEETVAEFGTDEVVVEEVKETVQASVPYKYDEREEVGKIIYSDVVVKLSGLKGFPMISYDWNKMDKEAKQDYYKVAEKIIGVIKPMK